MPESHPLPSREPDAMRATLEAMGEAKVRRFLDNGMLVHHLCVPAVEWLAELDAAKEAGRAPIER